MHLIPQNGVVGKPPHDHRSFGQRIDLVGRTLLLGAAVFHDRRTCRHAAGLKTRRRAAGQPGRRDHEDGEPPLPASCVVRHWLSPWL